MARAAVEAHRSTKWNLAPGSSPPRGLDPKNPPKLSATPLALDVALPDQTKEDMLSYGPVELLTVFSWRSSGMHGTSLAIIPSKLSIQITKCPSKSVPLGEIWFSCAQFSGALVAKLNHWTKPSLFCLQVVAFNVVYLWTCGQGNIHHPSKKPFGTLR